MFGNINLARPNLDSPTVCSGMTMSTQNTDREWEARVCVRQRAHTGTDPGARPRAVTQSRSCLWVVNREVCCPRTQRVQTLLRSSSRGQGHGQKEALRGEVWFGKVSINSKGQVWDVHMYVMVEAWVHPAVRSGLTLSQFPHAISYLEPDHTEQANSVNNSSKSKNESLQPSAPPQTQCMSSLVHAK